MFRQGFTCPALLKDHCKHYAYGAITHYGQPFQVVPLTPVLKLEGFSHFARHYSGNLG
jgi:hypothetical protein